MSHFKKSLGCRLGACTRSHYANNLCRSHYEQALTGHPTILKKLRVSAADDARAEDLLMENLELTLLVRRMQAAVDKQAKKIAKLEKQLTKK